LRFLPDSPSRRQFTKKKYSDLVFITDAFGKESATGEAHDPIQLDDNPYSLLAAEDKPVELK